MFMNTLRGLLPANAYAKTSYLMVIVYITLEFIMGQAVESVNSQLYQDSQTVNASACEFMELILKSFRPENSMSQYIAAVIIHPILRTLRNTIDNQDHAMQVHLLNLLKVIFFHSLVDKADEFK